MDARFVTCKTAKYSVLCLAGKPIATPEEVCKKIVEENKVLYCKKCSYLVNGKFADIAFDKLKITKSTFSTKGNSVLEEAEGEYEGKACTVLRTFNFCSCKHTYFCCMISIQQTATPVATPAPAPAAAEEEEEEGDLFGDDDDDEDEAAAEALAAKLQAEQKKKKEEAKKNEPVARSQLVLDVKPMDENTDLVALADKIKATQVKGLKWGEGIKLVDLAFGIQKLQVSCIIEDDICCEDDVHEAILAFEDEVQSVDTFAFNKM